MAESTVGAICELLNGIAPLTSQEEWDCSGLVLGRRDAPVSSFVVSLEAGLSSVAWALEQGSSLLVVHHPPLFSPVHSLTDDDPIGRALLTAARGGLAVAAWHTCWDKADCGVNFLLAQALSLQECRPLGDDGLGLVGHLPDPVSPEFLARHVCRRFGLSGLRWWGDALRPVRRLALCGGAGGDLLDRALLSGADCYFTGELKRHQVARAIACKMALIEADHYEVEQFTMTGLCRLLEGLTGLKGRVFADRKQNPQYVQREWSE